VAPWRPTSLFEGKEGKQKTEIHFDPATRMVTVKLLVQDPNGYFIPNIRRDCIRPVMFLFTFRQSLLL
jgi:hypothetical protein